MTIGNHHLVHPVQEMNADGTPSTLTLGMTVRQHYAGLAMQSLIAKLDPIQDIKGERYNQIARMSSRMADAMMTWVTP